MNRGGEKLKNKEECLRAPIFYDAYERTTRKLFWPPQKGPSRDPTFLLGVKLSPQKNGKKFGTISAPLRARWRFVRAKGEFLARLFE